MFKIRAVFFDAMNTLFRPRVMIGDIYLESAKRFGVISADSRLINPYILNASFLDSMAKIRDEYPNFGYKSIGSKAFWTKVVENSFHTVLGRPLRSPEVVEDLYEAFSTREPYELFRNAEEILKFLKERQKVVVCAISNADERLPLVLQDFGLLRYFDKVYFSTGVGVEKPDPKIYRIPLKDFNLKPEECVFVGDNVFNDYLGPKSLGMRAKFFVPMLPGKIPTERNPKVAAEDFIYDLVELKDLFKK